MDCLDSGHGNPCYGAEVRIVKKLQDKNGYTVYTSSLGQRFRKTEFSWQETDGSFWQSFGPSRQFLEAIEEYESLGIVEYRSMRNPNKTTQTATEAIGRLGKTLKSDPLDNYFSRPAEEEESFGEWFLGNFTIKGFGTLDGRATLLLGYLGGLTVAWIVMSLFGS